MPVLFVLDPSMDKDVQTVTLSYTFFNADLKAQATGALNAAERAVPNG